MNPVTNGLAQDRPGLSKDQSDALEWSSDRLTLWPRYYRKSPTEGQDYAETNYAHEHVRWEAPRQRFALVLVDVWNGHFSQDTQARAEQAIRQAIVPAVEACRDHGLLVIHAPGPPVAPRHGNWVGDGADVRYPPAASTPAWPPKAFKRREGAYAEFRQPNHPEDQAHKRHFRECTRTFHPLVEPASGEPVVCSGVGLQQVCADHGVVTLLYAGFNTNACIMFRNYGMVDMHRLGYEVALVRDATAAMETHETAADQACLRGAIASIEQFIGYTLTSRELVDALSARRSRVVS